ncbi:MAG: hypothetical protein AABW73_01055 [Nanoarchaeota archaeon]
MASRIKKKINAMLKIGGRVVEIPEIVVCKGFEKVRGLMFSRSDYSHALLFEFSNDTDAPIHSFFCPQFLAIWLDENNKIVDYKVVSPNRFSVAPQKPFRKLIEIPINKKYSSIVDFILERGKV